MLSGRIDIIANAIAERLGIDGVRALKLFYESDTRRCLHDEETGLYLFGELYIADELQHRQ